MKKLLFTLPILFLALGCDGNDNDPKSPIVAGNYSVTSDGCQNYFSPQIEIVQDGNSIVFSPVQPGEFLSASGKIDSEGQFQVSSLDFSCDGDFVQDIAIFTCDIDGGDCQMTYKKQN